MRALFSSIPIALLVIAAAGEEDFKRCYAGDYVSCRCGADSFGYAQCNTVDAFGPCVCDGTTPGIDAGHPEAGSEAGAPVACKPNTGTKQYFDDCAANEECASC